MGDKQNQWRRHGRSGPVSRVFSSIMKRQKSLLLASFWLAWMGTLLATVSVAFGQSIQLSDSQAEKIGRRLWQNESGGTIAGLTAWNSGEDFASLGIGHFIWYPAGKRGRFEESFPLLLQYLISNGLQSSWLVEVSGCLPLAGPGAVFGRSAKSTDERAPVLSSGNGCLPS